MKIAMIGHKRVPSREGGIEVVVEELAVRMAAEGHEVVLYNRLQLGHERSPKEYKGVKIRNVPTMKIKGSDAMVYSVLAAVRALVGRFDVVHFHAEGPSGMAWLTKLFRVPSVATIHGLDWQRGKWGGLASWYLKSSEKTAAKCADQMVVLSENMRDYFKKNYGRDTRFIRNGITIGERRAPKEILKFGIKGDDYILFLARLVPEKGAHYLIEAFSKIDTDLKLIIAGGLDNTDYVRELRMMAAKDGRVMLAGFVQGGVLDELFSNCRVYVLPSDLEGMPLSLLEALSYGAPCVVSDIPENHVAPEEYLTTFRPGDSEDLRFALEHVLNRRLPEEKQREQISWMKENYSWDQVERETVELYQEVIREKRGGSRAKT